MPLLAAIALVGPPLALETATILTRTRIATFRRRRTCLTARSSGGLRVRVGVGVRAASSLLVAPATMKILAAIASMILAALLAVGWPAHRPRPAAPDRDGDDADARAGACDPRAGPQAARPRSIREQRRFPPPAPTEHRHPTADCVGGRLALRDCIRSHFSRDRGIALDGRRRRLFCDDSRHFRTQPALALPRRRPALRQAPQLRWWLHRYRLEVAPLRPRCRSQRPDRMPAPPALQPAAAQRQLPPQAQAAAAMADAGPCDSRARAGSTRNPRPPIR